MNGVRKVEQLRFLESPTRTLGQAALLWLLKDERVASVLPNIYDESQLSEFAATCEATPLTDEEMEKAKTLYESNFGIENEGPPKFKGTMNPAGLAEVASG